jgi:predicted transcriptional regulator
MTIVRREHRAHFTVVPNAIFVDERLSIEAKGVLAYLLSRPNKWSVRLEQVGRILNVGRRKLQRVFRELITAGYVTREQRRIAGAQRFGQVDYVVRDVPVTVTRPVVKSAAPQVQNGPAAHSAQVPATPYKLKLWPRVQNGPAYKELKNKETRKPMATAGAKSPQGLPIEPRRQTSAQTENARNDAAIVALFRDPAKGWAFLMDLPAGALAEIRERYRRGELNELAILEFRSRYSEVPTSRGHSRQGPNH